jgi:hypothetical protein
MKFDFGSGEHIEISLLHDQSEVMVEAGKTNKMEALDNILVQVDFDIFQLMMTIPTKTWLYQSKAVIKIFLKTVVCVV